MKFSKLSLAAGILLGISGLISCNGVKPQLDPSSKAPSTPDASCISDGSFGEPQESAPIERPRDPKDDEVQDDAGCIMPTVVE